MLRHDLPHLPLPGRRAVEPPRPATSFGHIIRPFCNYARPLRKMDQQGIPKLVTESPFARRSSRLQPQPLSSPLLALRIGQKPISQIANEADQSKAASV